MSLCANAPHPALPHLFEILPPLKKQPSIAEALAAVDAECLPCMRHYRRSAGVVPEAVHFALTLFLMHTAIVLHGHDRAPGDNADAMVEAMAPETSKLLSAPTRTILLFLPIRMTTDTPDGRPAATWDRDMLGSALEEIGSDARERVWADVVGALTGLARGESRARQEAGL